MDRPATQQRVQHHAERRVQRAEPHERRARLGDRVDALLRPRPVRRVAAERDLRPDEALVGDDHLAAVGLVTIAASPVSPPPDLLHAERGMLLVGHARHHDVAREPQASAARHATSAAATPAFMSKRRARRAGRRPCARRTARTSSPTPDRVEVPAQQQRPPAAAPGARTTTLGRAASRRRTSAPTARASPPRRPRTPRSPPPRPHRRPATGSRNRCRQAEKPVRGGHPFARSCCDDAAHDRRDRSRRIPAAPLRRPHDERDGTLVLHLAASSTS